MRAQACILERFVGRVIVRLGRSCALDLFCAAFFFCIFRTLFRRKLFLSICNRLGDCRILFGFFFGLSLSRSDSILFFFFSNHLLFSFCDCLID